MTPLPRYVPGSMDRRDFSVDGYSFHVERGPHDSREVAFWGQGRDADHVPPSMQEPIVLARLVEGFAGLRPAGLGYRADSDEAIDRIERMMLERSGGYRNIYRQVWGNQDAAAGVLALPLEPGMKRTVYLSGPGPFFAINISLDGEGVLSPTDERVPAAKVPALLAAALARLGPHDVRVVDSP